MTLISLKIDVGHIQMSEDGSSTARVLFWYYHVIFLLSCRKKQMFRTQSGYDSRAQKLAVQYLTLVV